jgi:hypothetical protein
MRIRIAVGIVFFLVFGFLFLRNTDATFRSSDGKWADSEITFKGRDFRLIVINFEDYKLKCQAPKATLLRATSRNWINVFAWPNYLLDKKWHVPYDNRYPELGDYRDPNCPQGTGDWRSDYRTETDRADRFIRAL